VRFKGKITDWNDEKGYGFVTPNGGGPRVFVHIAYSGEDEHRFRRNVNT
jgi:cold shock CspA family protein